MNKIDLAHRTAIVTGGARGIGLAIARRLLESGASVSLWDVDPAALTQAREELACLGTVHVAVVDVASAESSEAAAAASMQALGRLDILVNNAGVAGANATPPDNCGGVYGYFDFVAAVSDPTHPEHAEMIEWIGRPWDPAAFAVDSANFRLQNFL